MKTERGLFVVLYGANNLGKSTQMELLEKAVAGMGNEVVRLKYPIYDLEPTGPKLNQVLRHDLKLPEREVQQLFTQNRQDYEPTLRSTLDEGKWVVSEDYTGTGIAWGLVRGLALPELEQMNKGLLREDIALMLYGERFKSGREQNHRNEADESIWQRAYDTHMMLADRYGWKKIYANRPPEVVHEEIMEAITEVAKKG